MLGLNLFLLSVIAIGNISLILFLVLDHNRKVKATETKNEERPRLEEPENKAEPSTDEPSALVGGSNFDIDVLLAKMEESYRKKADEMENHFNKLLDERLGNVRLGDVEFKNKEDAPFKEDIANEAKASMQLDREQTDKAFDENLRYEDVIPDEVSAPSASGASKDELEKAVGTAVDPNATSEEKAEAGAILVGHRDSELYEMLSKKDEIQAGLDASIKLFLEADMAKKSGYRHRPKKFSASKFNDSFDAADLIG